MDRQFAFGLLEQILGVAIVLFTLLDVFLTVLYARMGSSIIGIRLGRLTWLCFRQISKVFHVRGRAKVLSFCGPSILVVLVLTWFLGMTFGTALIFQPRLGTSIRATSGKTPTDLVTAMYIGGTSMTIVGASEFAPQSSGFRMLFLFNSLVGVSVLSLTLTYLMQIYAALQNRNAYALNLFLLTCETGDAAEMVAAIGPEGQFGSGYTIIADLASGMTEVKESHHFYPVLFYFRFEETAYSACMTAFIALDMLSLIKSGLDDDKFGWLKNSGAVAQLWQASIRLVTSLGNTFLPGGMPERPDSPDRETSKRWSKRYLAGVQRLQRTGIQCMADEQAGISKYIALRTQWNGFIARLAPSMAYRMEEIDPITNR